MPRRTDLHPLRTQRHRDCTPAGNRLHQRALDTRVAPGNADRAAAVGDAFEVAIETIVLADEARDECVLRVLVHLLRRVELLNFSAMKHRDSIRHGQRLGLIMRNVSHRHAEPLMQAADLELHLFA